MIHKYNVIFVFQVSLFLNIWEFMLKRKNDIIINNVRKNKPLEN